MKKQFIESEELKTVADAVITEKKLDHLNNVQIKYLLVDPYISKTKVAACTKASEELEFFGKFDILIKFSNNIWSAIPEKLKTTSMEHLLRHILTENKEDGTFDIKVCNHDYSDFSAIIKDQGMTWIEELKLITSSVNDLEPKDKDRVTL